MFMYFIYCNFGNVEIYFHKQNAMLFSSVTVAVINIILDYILIQKYGYIAASYATMVSYYIYAGLHYMFMSRVCKEKKVENPFNASNNRDDNCFLSINYVPSSFLSSCIIAIQHSGSSLYNLFVVGNKK